MTALWAVPALAGGIAAAWVLRQAARRHVGRWLPSYLRGDWPGRRERRPAGRTRHLIFAVADHYEPAVGEPGVEEERARVAMWVREYPALCREFRDSDGRPPRHTFFFPSEQYRPEHLEALAGLVRQGFGEVEIHLHHRNDTSENLKRELTAFVERLAGHGLLGESREDGRKKFGFVHGNWALDNSLPDGDWCGVNDELRALAECGCYADFTLPSAPSAAQTRRINSIYYAADDPLRPKSHDDGVSVRVGGAPSGDLMVIQGPLAVRWTGGKFGALPRVENGDLSGAAGMSADRVDAWARTGVCVAGRPEWVFVKAHTHGCRPANHDAVLGGMARRMHRRLAERYNDGAAWRLHYVTAREMFNIIKAAERGLGGDPGEYRDLVIAPPACAGAHHVKSEVTA